MMTDREDQKVEVEEELKNNSEIGNIRMTTDREDQNTEAEEPKNNSEIGNIRMMTDRKDQNIEAEEEPKNNSEIGNIRMMTDREDQNIEAEEPKNNSEIGNVRMITDRKDQNIEAEEEPKNNSEIGNIRMMTDRKDQNIEAEEEPKNNSEIGNIRMMTDREDQNIEAEEPKNNSEIGNIRMTTDRKDQNIEAEEEPKNNSEIIELSNQESPEKQRKNEVAMAPFTSSRKEKLRIATYELYNMEKKLTKKLFRSWNRSYLPSKEETEKKMREGRVVIKDKPHKSIQDNTIITATSRKGKEKIDLDGDLSIIHDLIVRFMLYVDNIEEMMRNREKREDDWIRYFEVGIKELQNINEILKELIMTDEMLRMREEQSEKYIKFVEIMCKLEEINSFLDESHHIGVVTEKDLTEIELRICELHLKRCNNDLDELSRISLGVFELRM